MRKPVTPLTDAEEAALQARIASDPDDGDATAAEVMQARPFAAAFPDLAASIVRSRGRPKVAAPKQVVSLRLTPATLERYKATGKNWRAVMIETLEKAKP